MFSSKNLSWETPQWLFDKLNNEFHFQLDVCATPNNAKCQKYYSPEIDGLRQDWYKDAKVAYCNPPYGREISKWLKKAYEESQKGCTVVCLIPSRTDTRYWESNVMKADEIRFVTGRLKFINKDLPSFREDGNYKISSAPFPSAIVVFRPKRKYPYVYVSLYEK